MGLEKIWYETSPFLYTVVGAYFLGSAESGILMLSSLLLISAGGTIMAMRRSYALKERAAVHRKPSGTAARPRRR